MLRYNEDEIITISYCNYLHYLGGNINELSTSQKLFKELILKFNFLILKKALKDIDTFLNLNLKILLKKHYTNLSTIDDLSYLHVFYTQLFFKYINKFPAEKYMPAQIDYKPLVLLGNIELKLNLDLILIQNNKDSFYHLISFSKSINDFDIRNNPLNYFKLKFLNNLYVKRKRRREPVKIHFLEIPEPTFRNRNQRDYKLKSLTIDLENYKDIHVENYKFFFNTYDSKKVKPRFFCGEKKCIKRKECLNANIR
jgi:hypothetical protein